jgi:DNA-binding MarR family transcriptional regulator
VFSEFDVRPVLLTTLTLISRNEPIRQSALGKALEMKRANVVTLLDELQQRVLIRRVPALDDRRSYVVELTDKGRKFTGEMLALHARLEADLARSFGEAELKELVHLLAKFRNVSAAPKLR